MDADLAENYREMAQEAVHALAAMRLELEREKDARIRLLEEYRILREAYAGERPIQPLV